jgi:putative heme-binding domain-containing protein
LRTAAGLARVQLKMQNGAMYVSRNWPLRVGEAVVELIKHDPNLASAIVACEDFKIPAQAFLARNMPLDQQQEAARKLIRSAEQSAGELRWTDDLVAITAALPEEERLAALRSVWDDFTLRDAIVAILARSPQPEDRGRFIESLSSVQPATVELAAAALEKLPQAADEHSLVAAMAALKQACLAPEQKGLRHALARLLNTWSGQSIAIEDPGKGDVLPLYQPWFDWLASEHPQASARLAALGTVDVAAWHDRLSAINRLAGDAIRGRLVFERKACLKCHAGNSPLGPDLAGAAGRLSPADLLAAIIDPSKDVSPLYQTTQVVSGSGRTVTGLIIYESPEMTLVQTDPDNTVRVGGEEIIAMRKSRVSLMPNGLLNDATDQDIADLFAHLKTLKAATP